MECFKTTATRSLSDLYDLDIVVIRQWVNVYCIKSLKALTRPKGRKDDTLHLL